MLFLVYELLLVAATRITPLTASSRPCRDASPLPGEGSGAALAVDAATPDRMQASGDHKHLLSRSADGQLHAGAHEVVEVTPPAG